jgi:Tfp pilus assembly protein PilN
MRPVNLIPQEQRRRTPREGSGRGAHAVLGVLALVLAMVVAYVLTSNTVTERKSDTEAARAEADQLEARATTKDNFTDFAEIAVARTKSVADVANDRFDWERFMRELSRVMPAGSWLSSADASVTGDVGTEGTGTVDPAAAATGIPAAPAATLAGCTPDQSDTARLMVRLSQLHRVEDVELNQSVKEDSETEVSVDSCGDNYNFDITVRFSAASPAREAPRGEQRVPASLGGGS